jgi:hypothetical protein
MGVLGLLTTALRDRFARRGRRKAIGLYLTRLPALLARDYGGRGPYTPAQVERAIGRYGLVDGEFSAYALAIFCDPDDVAETHPGINYDGLRAEIAAAFFGGDMGFKPPGIGSPTDFNPNSGIGIIAGEG